MPFLKLLILTTLTLCAKPIFAGPGDREKQAREQTLEIFEKLSRIPRQSGHEEEVRRFILGLVDKSPEPIKAAIQVQKDEQGNLLLTLPATGKYQGKSLPAVILQSHMDMVTVARKAAIGEDPTPYFSHGVVLVRENGWIHSKDYETTLGADDGIGVAIALRYLTDPSVEHPPLQLLFTVCEEIGTPACQEIYRRAPEMGIALKAPVLLNLDAGDANTVIYGCLGHRRVFGSATFPIKPVPAENVLVRISLAGLKGGHTGANIHLPRLNAALATSTLLADLAAALPDLMLVETKSGGEKQMTSIPASLEILVAVPPQGVEKVRTRASAKIRALVAAQSEESPVSSPPLVDILGKTPEGTKGIGVNDILQFTHALGAIRNGVVVRDSDPPFPHGLKASSSVGWLQWETAGKTGEATLNVGIHMRSFFETELDKLEREDGEILLHLSSDRSRVTVKKPGGGPPWMSKTDSWLFRLVRATLPDYRPSLIAGGLEIREFRQRFPNVEMLALGATMKDEHSPNEALNVESVGTTITALDKLLIAIADDEKFRDQAPH